MTVNPWGEVLQEAGAEETICWSEFDPAEAQKNRAEFPALKDRRMF